MTALLQVQPVPSRQVLPRLLYLSDVLAESSYSGSALVFRLLESYPADRLLVVETSQGRSNPQRRLRGVRYEGLRVGSARLAHTRFHEWWALWQMMRAPAWMLRAPEALRDFEPDALLTVPHGYAWVSAAAYAKRKGLPLHLIVHDDWPRMVTLPRPFTNLVDHQFGQVYRSAASRLCVSPWMAELYEQQYGIAGSVMLPSRAQDARTFAAPPERLREQGRGLTLALAGTIRSAEHFTLIGTLARGLQASGGRVLVFGPVTPAQGEAAGVREPNVEWCGLLESGLLIDRMRAEVDVLVVPMAFAAADAANMQINFPSKLTDYTAAGLPILIVGPGYSSAVRWAKDHHGVAEVVESAEPDAILKVLHKLTAEPEYRWQLAVRALEVGARQFSHAAAWEVFTGALSSPGSR